MQQICVLGATGSIGQSTLDVIARHPQQYRVFALSTHSRIALAVEQAKQCQPEYLVVANEADYTRACELVKQAGLFTKVLAGADALTDVASAPQVDTVMAAIVGAAGLLPTLAAVKAGKKVLLANKEALVMSGSLFMQAVAEHQATLLPIDSEHNAIFQCLPRDFTPGELTQSGIQRILLTGSGGPFLNTPLSALSEVSAEQACAHPNWEMGRKISVDSATMMNKGLEFIEACWLFGLQPDDIQVVLHPQSMIHSMVQYVDGSVLAQMGNPDMRTPIAHALAYPQRIDAGVAPVNFAAMTDFTFTTPQAARYPCLALAIQACRLGQYACTGLNAANEIAVAAFLSGDIGFTQIAAVNQQVLEQLEPTPIRSIEDVLVQDELARRLARQQLKAVK